MLYDTLNDVMKLEVKEILHCEPDELDVYFKTKKELRDFLKAMKKAAASPAGELEDSETEELDVSLTATESAVHKSNKHVLAQTKFVKETQVSIDDADSVDKLIAEVQGMSSED